jgi:hypothetical protein
MRIHASAGVAIHHLELELESVVEQLVAVLTEKRVQFPVSLESSQDELLLAA